MTEAELKALAENADKLFHHSSPIELKMAGIDTLEDGEPKTLWRMPFTGEIVEPNKKGAVEYRRWWAMISTEQWDTSGAIVERNCAIEMFINWMKAGGGNVRYMHEYDPVGHIFDDDYEIKEEGIYAGFSIPVVEKKAIQKIETGLIRFVSVGMNPNWYVDEPIVWEPRGIRWKSAIMVELSIGDFGACPGTQIVEEKSAKPENMLDRLKRHRDFLTAHIKKLSPGGTPDTIKGQTEEITLTEEQLKSVLGGLLKPITDRLDGLEQKVAAAPQTPEPPTQTQQPPAQPPAASVAQPATPPVQQNAGTPESQRMDKLESKLDTIIGALGNIGTGAQGQQSGRSFEERVTEFANQVKTGQADNHNAAMSFIKDSNGNSLTLERFIGDNYSG